MKTNKSPQIEAMLDHMSKRMFGNSRTDSLKGRRCVCCGEPAESFRDELSRREFSISGFCQKCQDETFGVGE